MRCSAANNPRTRNPKKNNSGLNVTASLQQLKKAQNKQPSLQGQKSKKMPPLHKQTPSQPQTANGWKTFRFFQVRCQDCINNWSTIYDDDDDKPLRSLRAHRLSKGQDRVSNLVMNRRSARHPVTVFFFCAVAADTVLCACLMHPRSTETTAEHEQWPV